MRNPPERYLKILQQHFAAAPNFAEGDVGANPYRVTDSDAIPPLTTNQAAHGTAFQRWFHFKEAFAPAFITNAIKTLGYRPSHVIDPFGGSGTTAITCQLLGINATTIEVNPFLADIISAKLDSPTAEELRRAAADFQDRLLSVPADLNCLAHLPTTFVEATNKTRWIFPRGVAKRLTQYLQCIEKIKSKKIQRFFKIILGAVLVECSNVYVNGKGRRYRRSWEDNQPTAQMLDDCFAMQFNAAFEDVLRFETRPNCSTSVLNGDSRSAMASITQKADLIVFSPPYPNSFDYTDIYNVELWVLGYLKSSEGNQQLRRNTLRSHVQIRRGYEGPFHDSKTLKETLAKLEICRDALWDKNIPEMVASYFRDLELIITECRRLITERGKVMLVVGDSRYSGVLIDVAKILAELSTAIGFSNVRIHEVRLMRSSAQQGGAHHLRECMVELCT